ncbi:MAG TPA: HIT family protein [Ktedonobacterales bacterium]|nr:HIT family protein [Ktedonobacterales bacterium]
MNDWKHDRIGSAERGENPTVIARMSSGFAVMGDTQFLPGYCLLLASPSVNHLSDLSFARRGEFLLDMSLLGQAIEAVCRPQGLRRMNYEILGNTDAYLHAHIFPRYEWEPPDLQGCPVWRYPEDRWSAQEFQFSASRHGELKRQIAIQLRDLIAY